MTKNKIIFVLATGLMFLPVVSLIAAEKTTTAKTDPKTSEVLIKKEMNDKFQKQIELRSFQIAEKVSKDITSVKTEPSKTAQDNLNTIVEKIYDKIDSKLSKLSIISSKISLKLAAFEAKGLDVSKARDQYDTAKTALIEARIEATSAKNVAFTQISIQTSKEEIRSLVKMTEDKIKSAGEEYRKLLPLFAKLEGDNSIKN